jgi:hypothetical protein
MSQFDEFMLSYHLMFSGGLDPCLRRACQTSLRVDCVCTLSTVFHYCAPGRVRLIIPLLERSSSVVGGLI